MKITRINKLGKLQGFMVRDAGVLIVSSVIVVLVGVLKILSIPPQIPISPMGTPVYAFDTNHQPTPTPTPTPTINPIESKIEKEFGKDATIAKRIAFCESGYQSNAENPNSSATGIFQILSHLHGIDKKWLKNPDINIKIAYEMFKSQGWRPWEASKNCWEDK